MTHTALLTPILVSGAGTAIAIGFIIIGIDTYRRYSGAGVRSLSIFAITWGILSALLNISNIINQTTGFATQPIPAEIKLVPLVGGFVVSLVMIAPLAWLMFILRYTSQLEQKEKLAILILIGGYSSISILVGLLAGFGETVGISFIADNAVGRFTSRFFTLVSVFTVFAAAAIGSARLIRTYFRFELLTKEMIAALLGSLPVPVILITISVMVPARLWGFHNSQVYQQLVWGIANGVGLGCLLLAVRYYGIFNQLPAASAIGRDTALESLAPAIVVLDDDRNVTDLNEAAEDLFETKIDDAIGDPLDNILPETAQSDTIWETGQTIYEYPEQNRIIRAKTTISTNDSGQEIGRSIAFDDITELRRRQQRIQVLNRVLRHNLRNELSVVSGYSQLLTDGGVDTMEYAEKIDSQVNELIDLGDTAREIEQLLSTERRRDEPVSLESLIEDAIRDIESDTDASITTNLHADEAVYAHPAILQPILHELIENAVEHNETGSPEVNVMVGNESTQIVISDNGPGIPEHEITVVESGEETPLEHGSGLGLWLVRWGIDRLGGTVSFETDSAGTRVTLQLPESLVSTSSE